MKTYFRENFIPDTEELLKLYNNVGCLTYVIFNN